MRAGLVLQMPGLPPKPKDAGGRLVKWVLLAQEPGFVYRGKQYDVDAAWLDERVGEYRKMLKGSYTAPLLREHDRDGERHGDILKLQRHKIDGRESLIGAVAFADPDAGDKIKRGQIKYLSPAFGPVEDDRGNQYAFALREASLVAAPHQKNLTPGDSHVLGAEAKEGDMPGEHTAESPELMDGEEKKDRLGDLEAKVDALGEAVEGLMELKALMEKAMAEMPEDEAEDSEEADMGEDAATVQMREELERVSRERDEAIFTQIQPKTLTWTPQLAEVIFDAWRQDQERVGAILAEATPKETAPTVKPVKPSPRNPWAVRLSESATPDHGEVTTLTDEEIEAKAVKMAEGDQVKANEIYKELKRAQIARITA